MDTVDSDGPNGEDEASLEGHSRLLEHRGIDSPLICRSNPEDPVDDAAAAAGGKDAARQIPNGVDFSTPPKTPTATSSPIATATRPQNSPIPASKPLAARREDDHGSTGGSSSSSASLHVQFKAGSAVNRKTNMSNGCVHKRVRCGPSVSSASSEESSVAAAYAPPDGGWGWVVVFASFCVNLIADGITFSFGVLYVELLQYFGEGKSKTAWIGSLFMAMPLLSGPLASFLTDRFGCRTVTIVGSILSAAGFFISSFVSSMEPLFLTFGIISGFGLSLCYVAAVVIVAYYFEKRRSFATGLSVCGSGIGTFLMAPLMHELLNEYGWRGTTMLLAGLFLHMAVCGCLMRDLPAPWPAGGQEAKGKGPLKKRRTRDRFLSNNNASSDSCSGRTAGDASPTLDEWPHVQWGDSISGGGDVFGNGPDDGECRPPCTSAEEDGARLCSSLVSLPTFVKNGEAVPLEALEMLSNRRHVYSVILRNYPSLLISRSFSDSGRLHFEAPTRVPVAVPESDEKCDEEVMVEQPRANGFSEKVISSPPLVSSSTCEPLLNSNGRPMVAAPHPNDAFMWVRRTGHHHHNSSQRRVPTAYLKDLRVHRHSLTYRGAMLNISRYRLRASSCPDIYRNSMTTIAKEKFEWFSGLWDLWEVMADMVDFSHFADVHFLLFAASNFLLYMWYDVPYVYLTDNAVEMGFTPGDGSVLISIIGIVNMVGEVILGWAGDKTWVNAGLLYAGCMTMCGLLTAMVPLLTSYYALCVYSGAFGLFIAANYSLTSIILVELISLERFTNAYGLLLLVQGVANLIGPPLAGWLYDITASYNLAFYLAGFFMVLSGVLLVILPMIERIRRTKVRQSASNSGEEECVGVEEDDDMLTEVRLCQCFSCEIGGGRRKGDVKPNRL